MPRLSRSAVPMVLNAAIGAAALSPGLAHAQSPGTVEEVEISAFRLPPAVSEQLHNTTVVDRSALEQSGGARLDEILRRVPGFGLFRRQSSRASHPTTQGVTLRGLGPSGAGRTLVLLDGVPQNDPFGGWVVWSALPSEGIGAANVIRGAGAGPYGAGALTGVVALTERDTPDGVGAAEVSVSQRSGFRAAAVVGGGGFMATLAGSRSDGYYPVAARRRGVADTRLKMDDLAGALRFQTDLDGVQAAVRLSAFQVNQEAGLKGARSNANGASAVVTNRHCA